MTRFASKTRVPVGRTQATISKLLCTYKATAVGVGVDYAFPPKAHVLFKLGGRTVQIEASLIPPASARAPNPEQHERTVWRMMLLLIKAKLEAVASGVTNIEREFLPDVVMPDGKRLGALLEAAASGPMDPRFGDVPSNMRLTAGGP